MLSLRTGRNHVSLTDLLAVAAIGLCCLIAVLVVLTFYRPR